MTNQPPFRSIHGMTPGVLDPAQPARLHRVSGSTFSFASFHPLTATPRTQNLENLSLKEEPTRPKRIVIETTPGPEGTSLWRFVPRARLGHGVDSEGNWPRLVNICGEVVHCSQDQWDIYKLDSTEYECFVPGPPEIPTVTRKKGKERATVYESERRNVDGAHPAYRSKRRLSTPSDEEAQPNGRKRFRSVAPDEDAMRELGNDPTHPIPVFDDGPEEEEVEDLLGNSSRGSSRVSSAQRSTSRAGPRRRTRETESQRQSRRDKLAFRTKPTTTFYGDVQEVDMVDLTTDDLNGHPGPVPSSNTAKRKSKILSHYIASSILIALSVSPEPRARTPDKSGSPTDSPDYTETRARKRHRTLSPGSTKQELGSKRSERERRRAENFKARFCTRRAAWHGQFLQDVMTDIPEEVRNGRAARGPEQPPQPPEQAPQPENDNSLDEEAQRQATIEESRRKLAELERDKPLWEEAARRRMKAERVEEEQRRVQREAQRQAREAEERLRRQQAERAEAERRARLAKEKIEREQEQWRRQQQQQRWSHGPWTTQRALERYKLLSEVFDNAKFSEDNPVTFDTIPWPVLQSPTMLVVEDIDWNAVEAFFRAVQSYMRSQDYKAFIQESHRRFHPDRWRARGILRSVTDEETRSCLEVASNTVAQALTPLWREVVKGG
ncbi:hypothetical protein DAEQUDRAFT_154599 [Daedalea quercina L-15889]|uniref:Uncharacterized protein n=1 Tax=Daedalea quercina L-15889 TaxID=1314783 RepID=A0A165RN46_9APHY|nr:hypothetical protein DAEQUDRAFT_154599 [Daedalea quercina L-15889]